MKKRHNKTSDDSKFQGTILGKPIDAVEIEVEGGGELKSIHDWISARSGSGKSASPAEPSVVLANGALSPTPSSGLSSVGDRIEEGPPNGEKMDLS